MIVTWILFILCITMVIGTLIYLVCTAHPHDEGKKNDKVQDRPDL